MSALSPTLGTLCAELAAVDTGLTRRMEQHATMLATLEEVSEALHPYVDVKDGEDGPGPNWAMRLQSQVDDVIALVKR